MTAGGHMYSPDEEGMLLTTKMLVDKQTWQLPIDETNDGVTSRRALDDGRAVGISGLAQSLAAAPLYAVGEVAARDVTPPERELVTRIFVGWTNTFATAIGALFFFGIARLLGASVRGATALTLVYALGTYVWPNARHFFSEPMATTLALAAVYLTFRGTSRHRLLLAGGLVAGLSLLGRPSNGIFLAPLGLYVLVRAALSHRRIAPVVRAGATFGVGAAGGLGVFLLTNWARFGAPLDLGYQNVPYNTRLQDGLYGLFLSPGRSIFLFAPITLVGVLACTRVPRRHRPEAFALLALGMANALLFAKFNAWHGDQAWGPRYMVMSTPFLALPVASVLTRRWWRRAVVAAATVGLAFAFIGTVMNWNQYTSTVDAKIGRGVATDRGGTIWQKMRYDPYWSPLVGHWRLLPDVVRNSWDLLDKKSPLYRPVPSTVDDRHFWYFGPPQLDSWWYYVFPSGLSKKLLFLALPFLTALAIGVRRTWRVVRRKAPLQYYEQAPAAAAQRPTVNEGNGLRTIESTKRS